MRVVTSDEMKYIEKKAEEMGIPTLILMENAAREVLYQVIKFIEERNLFNPKILIVCGRGNNGGDGLALARLLFNKGFNVAAIIIKGNSILSNDSQTNFNAAKNLGINIVEFDKLSDIKEKIQEADLIIDALLGTGISRELKDIYLDLVAVINGSGKPVISVDIPSGINACSGKVMGDAIRATKTVALGLFKIGHLVFPGREYCGELCLGDISLPPDSKEDADFNLILENEIKKFFKKREPNSHKGSYGHTVIIGGSLGKSGAPLMASVAALKTGSGLVTAVVPYDVSQTFQSTYPEIMTYPVKDWLKEADRILDFLKDKDALVIGCGLGTGEIEEKFFFKLAENIKLPTVIDADGLNILAKNINILRNMKIKPILTPHVGEMSRLAGLEKASIIEAPHIKAKDFAKSYNCYLILKSATTVLATFEDRVYFSIFGNPGMATAGSGDVLSGVIGSLLGQGYHTLIAAKMGLTIHGLAGDYAKREKGETSLVATDIIDNIFRIFKKWEEQ